MTEALESQVSETKDPLDHQVGESDAESVQRRAVESKRSTDYSSQPMIGGSIVGDVIYSIATGEEEGKSRQRILAFAAKRYQSAVERNPGDYDALYNWALVLQETADNMSSDTSIQGKDALLEEACQKYELATNLCSTLQEAFYNWAIAVSDRAKLRGRTLEAEEMWKQACDKYSKAVQLNWDSPQALNNWGLALQELGAIVSKKEKRATIQKAIQKFRAAIRLRFDFHRAVYNLGTVLYGLAEETLNSVEKEEGQADHPSEALYSQAAVYIAAAHALKSDYPVYLNALRLVRSMLPLPYLKAGFLTVAPHGNSLTPHQDWTQVWVVLDHEAIYQQKKGKSESNSHRGRSRTASIQQEEEGDMRRSVMDSRAVSTLSVDSQASQTVPLESSFWFDISQILNVQSCADLSLPPGGGMLLETTRGTFYMVADSWEVMDGWLDAIRLVYTIHLKGKSEDLAAVLAG